MALSSLVAAVLAWPSNKLGVVQVGLRVVPRLLVQPQVRFLRVQVRQCLVVQHIVLILVISKLSILWGYVGRINNSLGPAIILLMVIAGLVQDSLRGEGVHDLLGLVHNKVIGLVQELILQHQPLLVGNIVLVHGSSIILSLTNLLMLHITLGGTVLASLLLIIAGDLFEV